jgi:23S rRNA U2552 (ribose-2'-O)-methylase RlmE/FtsJ
MIDISLAINNTDKFIGGVQNSYKNGHNYQLIYKNFINKNISSILEIGTANGGFAKFLKDNLVSPSLLVGADIDPHSHHKHVSDHTNYNYFYNDFYIGNAFTEQFLNWVETKNYKFDLIVEDGDHQIQTQQFMLSNCNRLLKTTGIFICEDITNHSVAKQLIRTVPDEYKKYAYIWDGTDSIGRSDDVCIIIDLR